MTDQRKSKAKPLKGADLQHCTGPQALHTHSFHFLLSFKALVSFFLLFLKVFILSCPLALGFPAFCFSFPFSDKWVGLSFRHTSLIIDPQESARPYFTRPVSLCLVKGWRCFSVLGNSYFRHGRYQKRVLAKLNPLNEQHFIDQQSEVCRNSRSRPFPGKEASDSCSRLGMNSFHSLPVLGFVISIVKTFRVIPGLPKHVLH